MKRLTDKEIKKIKTDFVRNMKTNKIYENKAEIKEDLISYRDLFVIKDDIERTFVQSMITTSKNIPDELVGVWKGKKVGRKSKNEIEICEKCKTPLEDLEKQNQRILKTFNNSFYSPLREVKLNSDEIHCPNVNCVEYNKVFK